MKMDRLSDKAVGDKFETLSRMITPTEVDLFCDVTGMRADIFLDERAARAAGNRGRVVPGVMLLATVLALVSANGFLDGAMFLGVKDSVFKNPACPYDTLRVEGEVTERRVTSRGDRIIMSYSWTLLKQENNVMVQGINSCMLPNPGT